METAENKIGSEVFRSFKQQKNHIKRVNRSLRSTDIVMDYVYSRMWEIIIIMKRKIKYTRLLKGYSIEFV